MPRLKAGAAVVDITPPVGARMDGYGTRIQPSEGVHDPIFARVLVLDDGDTRLVIVGADLLGVHPQWVEWVRQEVNDIADIPPEHVLVAATHNHAGPAGLRRGLFSRLDETLARNTADKIVGAIGEAYGGRRRATLKAGRATVDTVSMNRRDPDWPIDPELRVLLVDGADGGPIASVMNFACHATVLYSDNLLLSAEFPGAACRIVQEHTGAPCLFLNGACANVNPTWIKQDFDNVERTGWVVGGQALRVIGELRTLGPGQRAHNIRWDEWLPKPVAGRLTEEPRLRAARREVDLPARQFLSDGEYAERLAQLEAGVRALAPGSPERREVMAAVTHLQTERWAARWARDRGLATLRTEVQAFALGDGVALLGLPGEFFAETAAAIRSAAGVDGLFVSCYTNDYVGYVIPPEAYGQGGYEAGITPCAPECEEIVVEAALGVLRETGAAVPQQATDG
ncbi:MAG: neutral/alkaline non-lysosomal ceramidase N-terminal domain-containing protein [Chloroflexi bacterium]|nr:neutral/alkaline non-lysosomal ceramidase N-terminal domain-containing protein [Chloroflexota bacterium]